MSDWDADPEGDQLQWRDTYFVWFPSRKRPTLKRVETALRALPERFELKYPEQDEHGNFETLTVLAPSEHVALEISYLAGDDLREEAQTLAEELKADEDAPTDRVAKLAACDARFDIMQFEQVGGDEADADADPDEMFDPSTLLIVLGALAKLVDGIGIDPQSGVMV